MSWINKKHHSEKAKRKISEALTGLKRSEETKRKMSISHLGNQNMRGKHFSNVTKTKMSFAHKGKPSPWKGKHPSEEVRKKMSNFHKLLKGELNPFWGKHHSREAKKKIGEAFKGEKSNLWKGGISFDPYGLEFNNELKNKIRERDKYRCQECGYFQGELKYKLHVHHIDYNKKNNNEKNLISLCRDCHLQTNFGREDWTNYYFTKLNG